ncbi:hypothetical protein J7Y46_004271 [Vibrio parahaemolyticus]|uniref:hypothetical protein n=1 Tax=Vibrio parahaemolyticus TaxID=670 RepID=UPI0006A63991|nr:hypothetical protein [Vibrio parahaemolyticus]EHK2924398.1 hypothetical protein [Vibrio parahaemolyticus]EHY8552362.1 hypothetical protein [Vibrio parahaemolyticus]EIA9324462.1 hypothetical protein [Vibrio parahaemolyticus]EIC5076503.1 hypothetical protein [Vibrio parahaemolyticus]KOE79154.1 hypothetical protein ACS87_01030 [Vibrio parahaemolyticus]
MLSFAEHVSVIDEEIADSKFLSSAMVEARGELKKWLLDRESENNRLGFEQRIMIAKAREYNAQRINKLAFEIADLQTGFTADQVAQVAAFQAVDTLIQLGEEFEDDVIDEMLNVVHSVSTAKLLVVLFRDEGSIEANLDLVRELREAKITGDIDLVVSVLAKAKALRAVEQAQ